MIKEIRVVLPAFGLTLSAAVVPLLLAPKQPESWMIPLFALGCVFMGALAFGAEFQQGTIDLLLVQPLRRTFIWREKMVVLGVGLALGMAALSAALLLFRREAFADDHSAWVGLALIPLCAFCATPLWTLLSRSFLVGVLASFLVPLVILAVNSLVQRNNLHDEWISAVVLLLVYCGVSCWLGHRRFERLQVVDEYLLFSREMGVPARVEAVLLRPFRAISARLSGTFGALLKKELRLQLINFVAAGLFCAAVAIEILVLALRYNSGKEDLWAWAIFGVTFYGFVSVIPTMVGAMSVAEEKTWGVADWQITLPPSVRQQWAAKMLVTLPTSLLLGVLLPWGLIWGLIPLGSLVAGEGFLHGAIPPPIDIFVLLVLGQLLMTSVAIYAAGLAGSTARSILLAFGMLLIAGLLIKLGAVVAMHFREPGAQILHRILAVGFVTRLARILGVLPAEMVLLLCLVQQFAFVCYRDRRPTRMQIAFQALVLGLSVFLFAVVFLILVRHPLIAT